MANILIVDDSRFSRSSLRRVLESDAHTVLEADSGMRALEIVQQTPPHIIILDLLMPEMRGQEVLTAVRSMAPDVRVIVLTADIQSATRDELMDLGADAFLEKPIDREKILQTVRALLEN